MHQPGGLAERRGEADDGFAEAVLDASADGILVLDEHGVILACNAAAGALLGRDPASLEEQIFGVPVDARGRTDGSVLQVVRPDGGIRTVELRMSGTSWRDRHITIVSLRDVTDRLAALDGLLESQHLLDRIVSSLEEAIVITEPGPDGRVIRMANPAAERIFGYPADELVGMSPEELRPDEDSLTERLDVLVRDGQTRRTDSLRRKDGTVFEAEQTILVLDRAGPGPGRVLNVIRDVSEARRAEAELRASEARLRQIAEHIGQVFWISVPAEGRIEYLSPAYGTIWGRPPEELLAEPDRFIESVLPSDRERVDEAVRVGPRHGHEIEYRIFRPDGEVRWIWQRAIPVERESGGAGVVIGVAEDITDRKQAEERHTVLSQELADLVYVVAPDGTIEFASASTDGFAGYARDEFVGRNAFELIHAEDRALVRSELDILVAEPGATARAEHRVMTKEGGVRHLESVALNRLDHPAIRGIVVTSRDVTERIELEKRLRQSQKMEAIGRLAGGIAHDFNNLLTVIRSQTDLLLMDLPEESPFAGEVRAVQEAADRAARLTSQLLAFSRDQVLRPRTVDLSSVVRDMGQLLERIIGEDIVVRYDLADDLPPVRIDAGQLEQAVLNLAVNGRDAMPRGGRLILTTEREIVDAASADALPGLEPGPWVLLRVSDTGTGMDEETQARIFEPFFTTKGTGKGTGLGLAMVYGFVKQSGGAIHVESRPGEGTSFHLRFPEVSGELDSPPRAESGGMDELLVEGRVLVVEDDPDVRRVTTRILERHGLEVKAVGDAEAGLDALERAGPFDLLLTDLVLPGMSGRSLVDEVLGARRGLKVVVMSGYAEGSPGRRGDLPGEVAFIQKPFTPDDLVEKVRATLRKR